MAAVNVECDVPVLNAAVKTLVTDPRVTMFLLPVPANSVKAPSAPQQGNAKASGDPPKLQPGNNANKKRKVTRAQKACPSELKEFNLRMAQGSTSGPICWGYNLKAGCQMRLQIKMGNRDAREDTTLVSIATSLDTV